MRLRLPTRTGFAAAASIAAAGLIGVAGPVAGASAATPPAGSGAPNVQPPANLQLPANLQPPPSTFVPPKVGPLSVDIAPIIVNGQTVNPALHVLVPGMSAAPITSTPPAKPHA
ncbi:MAG: hypothetical protein JWO74_1765 [Solirubrobacterales bacterium]|nr:hypothetical protein [Solirubrobacterales bacterium]